MVTRCGLRISDHPARAELTERYFADRADGPMPFTVEALLTATVGREPGFRTGQAVGQAKHLGAVPRAGPGDLSAVSVDVVLHPYVGLPVGPRIARDVQGCEAAPGKT